MIEFLKRHPLLLRIIKTFVKRMRFVYKLIKRLYGMYKSILPDTHYHTWASRNEEECFASDSNRTGPLISIVVPTFNTVQQHLLEMVYSVVNQHYENWEVILVNASSDETCRKAVTDCASIDSRIHIVAMDDNTGIAGNTNAGLQRAKGEYVAFLDHDDLLHPCALHSVASAIEEYNPGLIYTDEDKINHQGDLFFEPHCKPRWSPDLFRNVNYINHLTAVKTKYISRVGGLRSAFDGAQDYDLLLRIIDICQPSIYHIDRVLYHWRAAKSSTAQNIANKQYIFDAGSKALQEHLKRSKIPAKVKVIKGKPGFYKTIYEPPKQFSIVIAPVEARRHRLCVWWLEKLMKKMDVADVELVIGEWYKAYAKKLDTKPKLKYVTSEKGYWQQAARLASNEVIICFQEAAIPKEKNALRELAATALHNPVLATAPIIVRQNNTIIDAGFVEVDFGLQRLFAGYRLGDSTYFGTTDWVRNTMGLTMKVFAVRKDVFSSLTKVMYKDEINTFDLHMVYKDTPGDLPMCLLWAHTPFVYRGIMNTIETDDTYFNSELTQASATIHMQTSSWGKYSDRTES